MEKIISNITCHKHGRNDITVDLKNFQVKCKLCEKEALNQPGRGSKNFDQSALENLIISTDPVLEKFCFKHKQEFALYYCDDCSEFICKDCFPLEHRTHCCSTPELIVPVMKENVKKVKQDLIELKGELEANVSQIKEINSFFISNKAEYNAKINEANERITKCLSMKTKDLSAEIESFFKGIDSEVENSTQRLEMTKKKNMKMTAQIQSINKEIDELKSDKQICLYKLKNDHIIEENKKFLNEVNNYLNTTLEKIKYTTNKEIENFNSKCNNFKTNADIYENSVTNTIMSGIPNICSRIRRFRKYFYMNTKYFKTSSVCLTSSHSVNIVGFSICGMFKDKNSNSPTTMGTQPPNLTLLINIYEVDKGTDFIEKSVPIYSQTVDLPYITNVIDPVYQFYFSNAVSIEKDKAYYILINNQTESLYVNLWTGRVSSHNEEIKNHSVTCNNTNVKFNFMNVKGVESDFDEFTGGILSDIIFSYID